MTQMLRRLYAILYARVSTDEQATSGYSLAQQLQACREWAEAEGYEILEEITDPGHSGVYLERPGLDRVRDLVVAGSVAVVVAQDRDRFAREPAHLYILREEFASYGTKIRALNDRGDESPEGELADGILDQLAKFERAKIAERTRRGLNRKVMEGKLIRGNRAPYGFRYLEGGEALVVSEPEMGVVRQVFRAVSAEGLSLGEAARRLNRQGVRSPSGGKWCRQTVRFLLLNPLYLPLSADEVAASGLVPTEVARALDEEGAYGLWCWNRFQVKRWRERAVDGGYRNRVKNEERPREAWTAVPVPLAEAGLVRELVEAAREQLRQNARRPPSNRVRRFWQLSGGIAHCKVCGYGFSPHTVHEPGKIRCYYRCYTRYNSGLDACTNSRHMRADVLEELVWGAVLDLLSDPGRLMRQWQEHVERQRRQMRGEDPDREARSLVEKLHKLDQKESYLLDVASDMSMPKEKLRAKITELEGQRRELQGALEQARNRQQTIQEQERQLQIYAQMVEHFDRVTYLVASDADRRRLYEALRLRADIDRDGSVRLSGIFDPDVYLPGVLQDGPRDPSEPLPKVPEDTRVVVTLTSAGPCTS